MEKVRECGLKFLREEIRQMRKDGSEKECMETTHRFLEIVVGNPRSLMPVMRSLREEDTRWRRRAGARHETFDLELLLRGI
jgi:hypothetical protein